MQRPSNTATIKNKTKEAEAFLKEGAPMFLLCVSGATSMSATMAIK